eukprot:6484511-Amphidinium_carterae.1
MVCATMKEEIYNDIVQLVEHMLEVNITKLKDVRRLAGKCSHVASLLLPWRPFLKELWGVIAGGPTVP